MGSTAIQQHGLFNRNQSYGFNNHQNFGFSPMNFYQQPSVFSNQYNNLNFNFLGSLFNQLISGNNQPLHNKKPQIVDKEVVQVEKKCPPKKTPAQIEQEYLCANPDVAAAVASGMAKSGLQHYINFGKNEGRKYDMECLNFNEADYLKANPDVAAAVKSGVAASGLQHYMLYGVKENRKLK